MEGVDVNTIFILPILSLVRRWKPRMGLRQSYAFLQWPKQAFTFSDEGRWETYLRFGRFFILRNHTAAAIISAIKKSLLRWMKSSFVIGLTSLLLFPIPFTLFWLDRKQLKQRRKWNKKNTHTPERFWFRRACEYPLTTTSWFSLNARLLMFPTPTALSLLYVSSVKKLLWD